MGRLAPNYSGTLQKLDVLEAYTTTKDGKRVVVAPNDIREQQSPISANASMFDDAWVKTVVFPDVAVGSTLTAHGRKTQVKPLFPGQFSMLEGNSVDDEIQFERVTGLVTQRQRPQTASGVTFITLEDEFGPINVVVWSQVAARQRRIFLESRLLGVDGRWEQVDGVSHLIAHRLIDLSSLLGELDSRSRDFH